jgi:hypothetical protein
MTTPECATPRQTPAEKMIELSGKAVREGQKAARQVIAEIHVINEKLKTTLETKTRLSDDDRKTMLSSEQEQLKQRLTNELIETRTSIIMIENALRTSQSKILQYNMMVFAAGSLDDIVNKARIQVESSQLEKLLVQKTYLETVFTELVKATVTVGNVQTMERFKPVTSHLQKLLSDVDELQAQSENLAKLPSTETMTSGKQILDEGKALLGENESV